VSVVTHEYFRAPLLHIPSMTDIEMELRNRHRVPAAGRNPLSGNALTGTAALLATAVLVLLLSRLPQDLVLPVVGAVTLVGGAGVALLAWLIGVRRNRDRVTAWDFAGALLLVGFTATILSRPDHILQLAL
jgi:hypothetical protein